MAALASAFISANAAIGSATGAAFKSTWSNIEQESVFRHQQAATTLNQQLNPLTAQIYDSSTTFSGPTHMQNVGNIINSTDAAVKDLQWQAQLATQKAEANYTKNSNMVDMGIALGSAFGPIGALVGGFIGWSKGSYNPEGSKLDAPSVTANLNTGFQAGVAVDPNTTGSHYNNLENIANANQQLQEAAENFEHNSANTNPGAAGQTEDNLEEHGIEMSDLNPVASGSNRSAPAPTTSVAGNITGLDDFGTENLTGLGVTGGKSTNLEEANSDPLTADLAVGMDVKQGVGWITLDKPNSNIGRAFLNAPDGSKPTSSNSQPAPVNPQVFNTGRFGALYESGKTSGFHGYMGMRNDDLFSDTDSLLGAEFLPNED